MRISTILTAAIFLFISGISAQKNIDLRLSPASFDAENNTLYVSVEVRYNERGTINLAGQNYRLYYNSASLHLDAEGSASQLPSGKYAGLKVVDNIEGISADGVNQLNFDDNLGFVNLTIDLEDNQHGGITIKSSDSWVEVANLKFNILTTQDDFQVVWGRDGMSDQYATAFVEVSEWISPYDIKTVEVNFFEDLILENEKENLIIAPLVSVGPNPAAEYITIAFDRSLGEDATVIIRDISGRTLKNETIYEGQTSLTVDVANLAAANYFLEIHTDNRGSLHKENFIVAN